MYERDEAAAAVEQMLYDLEHNRHDQTLTVWHIVAEGTGDRNIGRAIIAAANDTLERLRAGDASPELVRRAQLLRVLAGQDPPETLDP